MCRLMFCLVRLGLLFTGLRAEHFRLFPLPDLSADTFKILNERRNLLENALFPG